ncbi:MAG TPA: LuxR C-terminal-related transcriptional regulator [Spirochaetia bacterium]|nr:LuxR C-terminal-related transcriptional regulator [Spirochaetia bacterium]
MSDFSFLKSWLLARRPPGITEESHQAILDEFEQFFTYVFNRSKDGISILDLDLTILGANSAMESWYEHAMPIVGKKCHQVYHGRDTPCANCPSLISSRTGRPEIAVVPYEGPDSVRGEQELSVFPLFDDNRRMFCLIEYVRDITTLKDEEKTIENLKRRIQFQDQTLFEQEAALTVLMRQGHKVERRVAQDIASNINVLIEPLVAKLKAMYKGREGYAEIELLESRLRDITSPLIGMLLAANPSLTQREMEVASLLRDGKSSKNIAELLNISIKAVDFHRMNIRKKLGIQDPKKSLQSVLLGSNSASETL